MPLTRKETATLLSANDLNPLALKAIKAGADEETKAILAKFPDLEAMHREMEELEVALKTRASDYVRTVRKVREALAPEEFLAPKSLLHKEVPIGDLKLPEDMRKGGDKYMIAEKHLSDMPRAENDPFKKD
jgi:hypothetical protein